LPFRLRLLQLSQVLRFVVDIHHLLGALIIECTQLLPRRRTRSLLKVRRKTTPTLLCLGGDLILLIHLLRLRAHRILLVELVERLHEFAADAMLLIESNAALDDLVAYDVAGSEVLGEDARTWLIILRDLVVIRGSCLAACCLVERFAGETET